MKKFSLILLGMAVASGAMAQAPTTNTGSEGYLSRSAVMFYDKNYTGTIDQARQAIELGASNRNEDADYFIALSSYKRGEGVDALLAFIIKYPSSVRKTDAWYNVGNGYFSAGKCKDALLAYEKVNSSSMLADDSEDYIYRKSFCLLKMAEFEEAKAGFDRLRGSKRYGECAVFYDAFVKYSTGDTDAAEQGFRKIRNTGYLWNEAQFYIAQIRFTKEDYSSSLAIGNSLLNCDFPKDMKAELYRVIGESEYHLGNNERAVEFLKKYVAEIEGTPQRSSLYILGVAEFRDGNDAEAIECFTDVVGEPDYMSQSAFLYLGQAYLRSGNMNGAAMAFEKAYKMDLDKDVTETALYNYAIAQSNGGRVPFSNSVKLFEDYLNRFPGSRNAAQVEEYIIGSYMTDRNYISALETIEGLTSPSARMLRAKQNILYHLAVSQMNSGKLQAAVSNLEKSAALAKYDSQTAAETYLWLGEAYYDLGKYKKSSEAYRSYFSCKGKLATNEVMANYGYGYALFQQKRYKEAKSVFNLIVDKVAKKSLKSDVLNRIGDCLYFMKSYGSAEEYYQKSLNLGEGHGDYALFQKGFMLGLQRQHKEKIAVMDEVVSEFPSSVYAPKALYEKAQAYISMDEISSAEKAIETLMKKYPGTADARSGELQLAILLNNSGKASEAKRHYKSLINKYPTSDEAKTAAEDLKVIYADEGNLAEYSRFMQGIDSSFKMDENEIDRLTFHAAENEYIAEGNVAKLKSYIIAIPDGKFVGQASYYIAEGEKKAGNSAKALEYVNKALAVGPDAAYAESALAMKAGLLMKSGDKDEAKSTYEKLLKKASNEDSKALALVGLLRYYHSLGNSNKSIEYANEIAGLPLDRATEEEVTYIKAFAYNSKGDKEQAVAEYSKLTSHLTSLYGSKAAVELAEIYFAQGKLDSSEKLLNKLIESGSSHQYWVARAFITMSDIYKKRGDKFQAKEYLESLKVNYPGTEKDIFEMIDSRLNELK